MEQVQLVVQEYPELPALLAFLVPPASLAVLVLLAARVLRDRQVALALQVLLVLQGALVLLALLAKQEPLVKLALLVTLGAQVRLVSLVTRGRPDSPDRPV